jgi:hypothetical protein
MYTVSQLTKVILDFYREEAQDLQRLQPLLNCQVFRRWGILYIRCPNADTVMRLMDECLAIAAPVAQLRLAKKINLLHQNITVASLPVDFRQIKA